MITLTVNGQKHTLDLEPETPLLWVLRDELGMTGTKFGCGIAQCGACSVHLNGGITRSCQIQIGDIDGATVLTIEGLSSDGSHPVQRAWIEHDVPQCGYCSPARSWRRWRYCSKHRSRPTATLMTPSRIFAAAAPTHASALRSIAPPIWQKGEENRHDLSAPHRRPRPARFRHHLD